MTLKEFEKKGNELLSMTAVKRSDKDVLIDLGLFGAQMAVIGLGVEVFADRPGPIGKNLMKLGALLGVVGYGASSVA